MSKHGNHEPAAQSAIEFRRRKLSVFARNCELFAERVAAGQIRLIDAADMLQSAAELSGLCQVAGDDLVQEVMAAAFTGKQARGLV